ncbi:MAG: MFS transporter [Actinomycetota bacterium]
MARTLRSSGPPKRAVFAEPGFAATYAVGVVWSLCRWAIGFLGAYVVAEATGSPRLVQLTGALLWAPLLFTGVVGGVVSDRFSRRTLLLIQFGVLGPLTAALGLLSLRGEPPLGVLYAFMVVAGFGWVIDMTVRRALVFDLVGPEHIDTAMAFEGLASAFGLMAGAMAGGALIGAVGAGGAYLAVAGAIGVAATLLLAVPPTPRPTIDDGAPAGPSLLAEVRAGLGLIGRWPTLASVLGVTALVNFFHFSYFPIVPVIAQRVGATPFTTGLLAGATGAGMAIGSTIVLRTGIRRGVAYVVGSGGGFVFLLGFAAFDRYWMVYVSLLLASSFVGMFGATQSALVMTAVDDHMRGRAMGLLSMAIGMLPIGMAVLGEVSEAIGAPAALILANITGLCGLLLFLRARPQAFHIR